MGAYFAKTWDQFTSIYLNLRLIYVNLHQCKSEYDQILVQNVKNDKMHVEKIQERHFVKTNAPAGCPTTSQRACRIENRNVNDVNDINYVNDLN